MQRQAIADAAPWGGLQNRSRYRLALLFVATAALLTLIAPVGCDYPIYRDAARAWLAGQSRLFDTSSLGFFYAPYSMALFAPLSLLPDRLASGLINAASLAGLLLAVRLLIGPVRWYIVLIAIANIWTANLIGSTQMDALTTAAVAVAWHAVQERKPWLLGAAIAFLGIKPTNVWLAIGVATLQAWRWPWRVKLKAAAIPTLAVASSFLISGWDWPRRYLHFVGAHPPDAGYNASLLTLRGPVPVFLSVVTAIGAVVALILALKRHRFDGIPVAVALSLNLIVSPYVTIYHHVATIPAFVFLGKRDDLWAVLLYVASILWVIVQPPSGLFPIYPLVLSLSLAVSLWTE